MTSAIFCLVGFFPVAAPIAVKNPAKHCGVGSVLTAACDNDSPVAASEPAPGQTKPLLNPLALTVFRYPIVWPEPKNYWVHPAAVHRLAIARNVQMAEILLAAAVPRVGSHKQRNHADKSPETAGVTETGSESAPDRAYRHARPGPPPGCLAEPSAR